MDAQTVLWRAHDPPGCDYCRLTEGSPGPILDGVALLTLEQRPVHLDYHVECDAEWRTRTVTVEWQGERVLQLAVDARQRWFCGEQELFELCDLIDIDLSFTPATNALPIRRLSLARGASSELTVAWLRFPEWKIEPLRQTYTRLDERLYRFTAPALAFQADLTVDDKGLVVEYEGLWTRAAAAEV